MRVLAFDPGAERMGYACVEKPLLQEAPICHGYAHFGLEQETNGNKLSFQDYRLALIDYWLGTAEFLLHTYEPEVVVNEIVPPMGGSAANQIQRQLATTALTTVQAVCRAYDIPVTQIAASTVKSKIGGKGKATKVAVRNGVLKIAPQLSKADFVSSRSGKETADTPDALAIAFTYLGYDNR
jgi:Holliday junction resolvasome RuvABC endonuclease subunit